MGRARCKKRYATHAKNVRRERYNNYYTALDRAREKRQQKRASSRN